jgi:predicted PurR-regulated permease PerM
MPTTMATTRDGRVAGAVGWAALALLVYIVYRVIAPLLPPLGWAAVLAIAVQPLYARLERPGGRSLAALASALAVTVVLVVPAVVITIVVAGEAIDASSALQRAVSDGQLSRMADAGTALARRLPGIGSLDVRAAVVEVARRAAELIVAQSGLILRDVAVFAGDVVIALVATFFLLRDSRAIVRTLRHVMPVPPPMREALMAKVADLVAVGVTATAAVAAVQGLLGGISFWLLGIPAPVFWGVVTGLLCLLPFGAWLVWLPAALLLAFDGQVARGLMLAGLGIGVVSGVDNVLRPALVSGRSHMHGLTILVGLLGGAASFGALGVVVGPVVLAVALTLLAAYVESLPAASAVVRRSRRENHRAAS